MELQSQPVLIGLSVGLIAVYAWLRRSRSRLPLPPGPPKSFLVGNLLQLPSSFEWETYHQWSLEYDTDIIHLDAMGTDIIVLDSYQACVDIFEKRSSLYSGRPRMPMINEVMGWDWHVGFMPYGDRWRAHRRVMHQHFHEAAVKQFYPLELKACHKFLGRMLDDPDEVFEHMRRMAGEIIIPLLHGFEVLPHNDPFLDLAEAANDTLNNVTPGRYLVDRFPFLQYVPSWFPGAQWKRDADAWAELAGNMVKIPFNAAKRNFEIGEGSTQAFLYQGLSQAQEMTPEKAKEHEEIIANLAGAAYSGGSDTSVAVLSVFFLGLLMNPGVMKKAQEELDSVLSPGELPTFDHESSLPYITAVALEVLRWIPVTPFATPHLSEGEDVYKGYRIPAGAVVIGNAWAILQDPEAYPEPDKFNPDRFMKDGKLDPSVRDPRVAAVFGFGRRICPGRHLGYATVWLNIAAFLATFTIDKARDSEGRVIEPKIDISPGIVTRPKPFKATYKPRSKLAEEAIRAALATA